MIFSDYVPGAIALIVVIGIFVLIGLGQTVGVELWSALSLVLGFFFGNQAGTAVAKAALK
jgi:hypothetical protein